MRSADAAVDGAYDRAAAADAARRLVAEKRRAAAARRATEARETTVVARREAAREAAAGRAAAREAEARRAAVVRAAGAGLAAVAARASNAAGDASVAAPRPDWDALRDVARRDGEAASRALRLADDALRRRSSSFSGWTRRLKEAGVLTPGRSKAREEPHARHRPVVDALRSHATLAEHAKEPPVDGLVAARVAVEDTRAGADGDEGPRKGAASRARAPGQAASERAAASRTRRAEMAAAASSPQRSTRAPR